MNAVGAIGISVKVLQMPALPAYARHEARRSKRGTLKGPGERFALLAEEVSRALGEGLRWPVDMKELSATHRSIQSTKETARKLGTLELDVAAIDLVRTGEPPLMETNRVPFVA